jgi:cell division septum initiation protein DivIVA
MLRSAPETSVVGSLGEGWRVAGGSDTRTSYADADTVSGAREGTHVQNEDHDRAVASGHPSAARLLEMTARETDRWRSDALAEAAEIVAAARNEAGALVRTAQREVDQMMEAARVETAQAETEVARLQRVAADHAHELRSHLHGMLERIDSSAGSA